MPVEQGFGSDGSKEKVWHCPKAHSLKPWKAIAGLCDGCKRRVTAGEYVMDCRKCNWYLCDDCHPQEREKKGWLATLSEMAAQEFNDFKEMVNEVETMGPLAACSAVDPAHRSEPSNGGVRETEEELTIAAPDPRMNRRGVVEPPKAKATSVPQEIPEDRKDPRTNLRGNPEERAAKEAAEAAAKPVVVEEKPKPPEDLLDFGQNDLLDLDTQPAGQKPAPKAPAPAAPPAAKAPAGASDDLLDLGL